MPKARPERAFLRSPFGAHLPGGGAPTHVPAPTGCVSPCGPASIALRDAGDRAALDRVPWLMRGAVTAPAPPNDDRKEYRSRKRVSQPGAC